MSSTAPVSFFFLEQPIPMSRCTGFSEKSEIWAKYGHSDAIALNFFKKLDSADKFIFHVSNLNTRVLDPPTHSHQFDTNCGKIRYVSDP